MPTFAPTRSPSVPALRCEAAVNSIYRLSPTSTRRRPHRPPPLCRSRTRPARRGSASDYAYTCMRSSCPLALRGGARKLQVQAEKQIAPTSSARARPLQILQSTGRAWQHGMDLIGFHSNKGRTTCGDTCEQAATWKARDFNDGTPVAAFISSAQKGLLRSYVQRTDQIARFCGAATPSLASDHPPPP